jgi:hypothetical protein
VIWAKTPASEEVGYSNAVACVQKVVISHGMTIDSNKVLSFRDFIPGKGPH